ncbi:MAG: N-6 DNA methylase [Bacteroidales bacterium]|nr:N-6 DNA methylase [Candidatus Sodaliphilus aphodohippi]
MQTKTKNAKQKSKTHGQIFTPDYIVQSKLQYCNYDGDNVLRKHIIDNSCGDGAFLCAVVRKYITVALYNNLSTDAIKIELETYIHGIDIDTPAYEACIDNLSAIATEYGISDVNWDVYNRSSLSFKKFNGKMDYVVGNPPYVRVHNLEANYDDVKKYKFANGGMTDLFLAFFELGFNLMSENGKLCYITPSSWLNSVAAENMRLYIMQHKNMVSLIDLEHYQAFENATAYTLISYFEKQHNDNHFDYYTYNGLTHQRDFVENLTLEDVFINSCFYLSDSKHLNMLREIKTSRPNKYVSVKNGFATLADSVFIGNNIPDSTITIKIIKGSTGKWYKCLFPYDKNGKPLSEKEIFANKEVKEHLLAQKEFLLKGKEEYSGWYLYGRTQALADVYRPKLSVNSLVRTEKDLKLFDLKVGEGIYSGLYIITDFDIDFEEIKRLIVSADFIEYVKLLKKYKSGGYYTFNSKDLEQFINFQLTYKTNKQYAIKSSISAQNPDLFQGIY